MLTKVVLALIRKSYQEWPTFSQNGCRARIKKLSASVTKTKEREDGISQEYNTRESQKCISIIKLLGDHWEWWSERQ